MSGADHSLCDEINKRLTLNWLIQGAAQHAGMTFHHLLRDEFEALDPRLVPLYDQYALINVLQYWHLEAALIFGRPRRFWRRAATWRGHPFFGHPILSKHGGALAEASRQRAVERAKEKGLTRLPLLFTVQTAAVVARLRLAEAPHWPKLVELAKGAVSTVWGIPVDRLDGELMQKVFAPPSLIPARSVRGSIWRAAIVGYGGVQRRGDGLIVVGRGTNWQLLAKELVKGTAELVCLHGLNQLSDDAYARVMDAADWLEYEPWALQTGGELWRRLLALLPAGGQPVAEVLMHMARLPAKALGSLVLAVLEQPEWARELLGKLGDAGGD